MTLAAPSLHDLIAFGLHGATFSETADGPIATMASTGRILSPWHDLGSGNTLARFDMGGTATGTVYGAVSASLPDHQDTFGPIDPGTWGRTYDPGLGTKPDSQGWTAGGGISTSVSGGYLRHTGAGWYSISPDSTITSSSRMHLLRARFKMHSGGSHVNSGGILFGLPYGDSGVYKSRYDLLITGTAYGSTNQYRCYDRSNGYLGAAMSLDTYYDVALLVLTGGGSDITSATLWRRPSGSYTESDLTAFECLGRMYGVVGGGTKQIYVGNYYDGGSCDMSWGMIRHYSGIELETFTDGMTSFTRNGRYVRIWGDRQSGTITDLRLRPSTSTPTTPGDPEIKGTTNGDIIADLASAPANTERYKWELHDGSDVVATKYSSGLAVAFADPGNGTYTVRCTSIRDNGTPSASYGESAELTLPVSGGSTPPSGCIIEPLEAPMNVRLAFDGVSTLKIYHPTLGSGALSSVTLERCATATGTFTTDATQGVNPKTYASLSFTSTTPAVGYATNHGWTLSSSYWYRVKWTDANGSVAYSGAISGATQAANEITVSGAGLGDYAGRQVQCRLTSAVSLGGRTYVKTQPYNGTVAADGTWSITNLPRLAKAGCTALDGSSTFYAVFTLPDGTKGKAVTPDQGSVSFENLTFV